jgi:glucokinase
MDSKLAVGIDLGGTNIKSAMVTANGEIALHRSRPTLSERGPNPVLDDMVEMVDELVKAAGVPRDNVVGLGLGSPGPLSHRDGVIYKAANLPGWKDVRVRRYLLEHTGLPSVLDNDANAAAFGEFWVGAGKGKRDIAVLTLGTGIGAGAVLGGEVLRGHFENASEIGHLIVHVDGKPCSCGQLGCLEAYASPGNLAHEMTEMIRGGQASSLAEVLDKQGTLETRDIAEACRDGDELATEMWDRACKFIAVGCINIQHAYNVETLVLGGGMANAGALLLDNVRRFHREMAWRLVDDAPEIVISKLGHDAGVIGAAGLAWAARDASIIA